MLLLLPLLSLLPSLVLAGVGTFTISEPLQCGNLGLSWTRTGSIAATNYNLVLIPTSDQNEVLSNLTFSTTETS
ncbi:hypothetical protein BDY24DRAFT_415295 [Mrakia frigida]|uniref:uncharacterized protein n=1 Tax=Mrakia frigida TaxID=29902 RepID=UPI003FCC056C